MRGDEGSLDVRCMFSSGDEFALWKIVYFSQNRFVDFKLVSGYYLITVWRQETNVLCSWHYLLAFTE